MGEITFVDFKRIIFVNFLLAKYGIGVYISKRILIFFVRVQRDFAPKAQNVST